MGGFRFSSMLPLRWSQHSAFNFSWCNLLGSEECCTTNLFLGFFESLSCFFWCNFLLPASSKWTFDSPKWRSLNPRKGHLKHSKRSLGRTWWLVVSFFFIFSTLFGGDFENYMFTPICGEMIQFDFIFFKGGWLKPPTSVVVHVFCFLHLCLWTVWARFGSMVTFFFVCVCVFFLGIVLPPKKNTWESM